MADVNLSVHPKPAHASATHKGQLPIRKCGRLVTVWTLVRTQHSPDTRSSTRPFGRCSMPLLAVPARPAPFQYPDARFQRWRSSLTSAPSAPSFLHGRSLPVIRRAPLYSTRPAALPLAQHTPLRHIAAFRPARSAPAPATQTLYPARPGARHSSRPAVQSLLPRLSRPCMLRPLSSWQSGSRTAG